MNWSGERAGLKFALPPMLVMVLGLTVFELTGFGLHALPEATAPLVAEGGVLPGGASMDELRARLLWGATLVLFYCVMVGVLVYAVILLRSGHLSRSGRRLYAWVAVLLCAGSLVHVVASGLTRNAFSTIFYFTVDSLRACGCFAPAELIAVEMSVHILNFLAAVVPPLMLAAGCSLMALPEGEATIELDTLGARARRLKSVLHAGSALLVAGLLHQVTWMQWPTALIADRGVAGDVGGVAQALGVYWGTIYTLLVVSFYAPCAWVIGRRARELLADVAEESRADAWLEAHGLSANPVRQVPQIAAMLAPVIAGPLGASLAGFAEPLG